MSKKTKDRGQKTGDKKQKPAVTITVDYQKKCGGCGKYGATASGYCLSCVAANTGKPRVLADDRGQSQPSLPNAEPELDAVGVAARRFQLVNADLEELAKLKMAQEAELIEALRAAGRRSIKIGTVTLTLTHKDAVDKIAVKKGRP